MIGSFALAGYEHSQLIRYAHELASKMATDLSWRVDVFSGAASACGRIGPERTGAVWSSSDGVYRAWLDGFAYTLDPLGVQADKAVGVAALAKALLFRGPDALLEFQGEFFLLVLDQAKRTLLAATDRFGVRTTYYYVAAGHLAICSELGSLVRLGLVPNKLDRAFAAAILRFNKCRLGDRTIFSGARVVPPGTVQEYDLTRIEEPRHHTYYRHVFRDVNKSLEEWVDAITPLLCNAVQSAVHQNGGTTALALSGGLDSRILLGALDPVERAKLFLVSCGMPESSEIALAAETAASVGSKYTNVDLGPSDFLSWARTGVQRNEEFDIFVQGAQAALHTTAAQTATTLMTGWDIDVPLRGTYLNEMTLGLRDDSDVKTAIDKKWSLFSRQELGDVLQDSFFREVGDAPEDWLKDLLSLLPNGTPLRQYLQFIFRFEKHRLLMLRNRMIRFEVESVLPLYNNRLQLLLANIPESQKIGDRLFAQLFNRIAPDLAAIPYQRTMLPACVPVEYWPRGTDLEDRREALMREIFVKTGISIPYTRYYSNFDEWLRADPKWHSFVTELLDSERTLVTQELVKPMAVRRLLEAHKTETGSQRTKLVYLLSLELYLREYFD